jgi:hypothetical protein
MHISLPERSEYQVQASTNLRHWTTIFARVAHTAMVQYVDTSAGNYSCRFYRVVIGRGCSTNVVGYISLNLPPGFAMIANPLLSENNTVESLFPNAPDGTTLTRFDTHQYKLIKNSCSHGKWINGHGALAQGEGAMIFNPTDVFRHLTFVGEVQQGDLSMPLPYGFSVRSSMVPVPGALDSDLNFPVVDEDVIHLFDRDRQKYVDYSFSGGRWNPEPPVVGVGEAFWVAKCKAGTWAQHLKLNNLELDQVARS